MAKNVKQNPKIGDYVIYSGEMCKIVDIDKREQGQWEYDLEDAAGEISPAVEECFIDF